ncbi:uncharacterized protein A4U43_C03F24730 [Asparagus officinalis]|uniref:Uncharacterized protein n=1 Tax=Asparagus officinalis TaxID=4686 RepID=A0A5P1FCP3_ASPOF|nr:uncharacterized protein A4U43_C03F24730 [Asparagus officinalis]
MFGGGIWLKPTAVMALVTTATLVRLRRTPDWIPLHPQSYRRYGALGRTTTGYTSSRLPRWLVRAFAPRSLQPAPQQRLDGKVSGRAGGERGAPETVVRRRCSSEQQRRRTAGVWSGGHRVRIALWARSLLVGRRRVGEDSGRQVS